MTAYFDRIWFQAVSSGTGAFVVSSAVTGYRTPAIASIPNGTTVTYVAESADKTQWEIGEGVYSSGSTSISRDVIRSSSTGGSIINFGAAPFVFLDRLSADILGFTTIAVSGQSDVVADGPFDPLTLVAGTGISITTNATTDTITFASTITQYTDEQAQDAVGNILVDGTTINFTYNDATPSITAEIIESNITTLSNLSSIQGRTVTLTDAGFDVLLGWDDSASAYKNFALADITSEAAPATGDFVLIYRAEGDLRKVDWGSLPGAGSLAFGLVAVSGQSNVVADAATDTLNLAAGTGISITTDAGTDTVTIAATDEGAQDAVGTILVDSGTINFTYNDGTPSITADIIESGITTLSNLSSVQGRTIGYADAGFDVLWGWDDSASTYRNFALAEIATEGSPAAGDFILAYGAEGDLRKVNWSSLPAGGAGGASNPKSAFRSHKNGSDQTFSSSSITQVTWGTETFDVANEFASNVFTAAATGYYYFEAQAYYEQFGTNTTEQRLYLRRQNGSIVLSVAYVLGSPPHTGTLRLTAFVQLTAGDIIEVLSESVGLTAGSTSIDGTASNSYFCGHLITGSGDVTGPSSATDNAVARFDSTTGRLIQNSGVIIDDSNNVSGVAALSATTIELGHASDTTLARSSAGNVSIEGNVIYRAGGTDVALADGGTGASLSDPNADRIFFWDDSVGATDWLAPGNSIAITTTTIDTIQDIRTTASPQFAGVNIGAATDTTITRVSAGVIAVEGSTVPTVAVANTWTALQTFTLGTGATNEPIRVLNTTDNASVQVAQFEGDRATPAANDEAYQSFLLSDSAGNQDEFARFTWRGVDVTSTSNDARLTWSLAIADALTAKLQLEGSVLAPAASDGTALGSGSLMWADLFLASGGIINFNNGNYTITHSAGLLTTNGNLSLTTSGVLTVGTIELGAASDTTLSRSSAGVLAVEGVTVSMNSTSAVHTAGTIELGAASDTTLARSGAGDVTIEGNIIYRAGGTDVALADGGTGTSLTDPNADRVMAWDDSAGLVKFMPVADFNTEAAPASGDFLLAYTAEGALVKIDWSSLPVGGGGNAFGTIVVSGQSDVVADAAPDTLTLVAGTNITITTNASTDTITINASGGSGSPGGSDTQFQYNNGGAFGGTSGLSWDDSANKLVYGATTSQATVIPGDLQIHNTDGEGITVAKWSNDFLASHIELFKSRGAIGNFTVVQVGDIVGSIIGCVADGTDAQEITAFHFEVDAISGGVVGGRMSLQTQDEVGNFNERWRVNRFGAQRISYEDSSTNTVIDVQTIRRTSTSTPASGIGAALVFELETSAGAPGNLEIGGRIACVSTDVGSGTEDFDLVFSTMAGGAAAAERFRISSVAGEFTVNSLKHTASDAGFDVVYGWDDSAGTYKSLLLADIATEGAPAAGDFLILYGAEGDLRKVNWSSLPGAGGGISNVVEDTTPQLGGPLDMNGQYLEVLSANTNTAANIKMRHTTSGTPAAGIGLGLQFEVETATAPNYEIGAVIEAVTTDVTDTSEDFDLVFRRMGAGAAAAESVRFSGAPSSTSISLSGSGKGLGYTGTRLYLGQDGAGQFFFDAGGGNVSLHTDAANILAQRDSTNAQTFRVYNTFTDASNYERAKLTWNTNVLEVGAEAAGSGTLRAVKFFGLSHTFDASGTDYVFIGGNQVVVGNGKGFGFASGAPSGGFDAAMHRNAAGVIEVNNGSAGTFRDIIARAHLINHASDSSITRLAAGNIQFEGTTAATSGVENLLRLRHSTTGTAAAGIGIGIQFEQDTGSDNYEIGAFIRALTTDVGAGSEDFDVTIGTMAAGAAAAERLRISENAITASTRVLDKLQTLTDGANVTLNARLGNGFKLVAAGNRQIDAPTNKPASGETQRIVIAHEASGADRTLTLQTGVAGGFRFGTDITGLTATTSGLVDYIGCIFNQADDRWDVVSYVKGY